MTEQLCITCDYWVATHGMQCEACAIDTDNQHRKDTNTMTTTLLDRIQADHDAAKAKVDRFRASGERRQFDYWQGVYDALHNLLFTKTAR